MPVRLMRKVINLKNKIAKVIVSAAVALSMCTSVSAANYYASDESGDTSVPEYINTIDISKSDVNITTKSSSSELTPSGNLSLIDDYAEVESSDEISQKQFMTVTTKSGNTFYIVVDRNGETENVYLLNLVDEADLMALINDEKVEYTEPTTAESTTESGTESETESNDNAKTNSNAGKILVIFLIAAGGGFAVYWFKFKNKDSNNGNDDEKDEDYEDFPEYDTDDSLEDDDYEP